MNSYSGSILQVDLDRGSISIDELNEDVARKFIGGRGLAAKLLFEGIAPGVDPLGPSNLLVFAVGPLADTPVPGAARFVAVAKSPLTGAFGEAYAGGAFGLQLRRAGFDAITIKGQAKTPTYLSVLNGECMLHDASGIWGMEVKETNEAIIKDLGVKSARVVCIGPAGERLVRFANILTEVSKAAGRCGLGAVMGSKNLKAIAVHGEMRAEHYDPGKLRKFAMIIRDKTVNSSWQKSIAKYGTGINVLGLNDNGALPTRNYTERQYANAEQLGSERVLALIARSDTCPGCGIHCDKAMRVTEGRWQGVVPEYGGAEYETIAAMGSNCLNSDLESIAWMSQRCNALGIDTISMGSTLSMLMEANESGFIKDKALCLEWGDTEGMARMIELTGHREGVGDMIAEGGARLATRLGCPEISCNSKGLDVAMHEPRIKKSLGLCYATANRGATHMESPHDPAYEQPQAAPELGITESVGITEYREKGLLTAITTSFRSWNNSLVMCLFNSPEMGPNRVNLDTVAALSAATGWDYTIKEALETGDRIYNLCRLFNIREGFGRTQDTIPHKFTRPTTTGRDPNEVITSSDFEHMLREYYTCRGWDEDGKPTIETLRRLGLEDYLV